MTLRSVVLAILSLLALIFLILNWQGITAPVPVSYTHLTLPTIA